MAQYRRGTASVSSGSAVVTGVGTEWLTNVRVGDSFTVAGAGVLYDVASVASNTSLSLSTPYTGASETGAVYAIARDFTSPDNFPELTVGDIETPVILTRAIRKIQQRFNLPGDVAEEARDIALAAANFKGRWEDQTGALNIPVSVYHKGRYWLLLDNLADVTAAEPGESPSWDHIYDGNPLAFGPGPQTLIAGDMTTGFFGEVSADELFRGDELALMVGVTEGVAQNSTGGWLKFAHNGKIKYIAKQTFRHSISWDYLYSRGLVYGTDDDGVAPRGTATNQFTTVKKDGSQFVVRLMTCTSSDPFPESDPLFFTSDMYQMDIGGGSEWNELIYRVCVDVPSDPLTDGTRADRHGGPQVGVNWATYTATELNITASDGVYTWGQEHSDVSSPTRVVRGQHLAYTTRYGSTAAGGNEGWRPCLELIPTGGA